jgi:hypothetical protein
MKSGYEVGAPLTREAFRAALEKGQGRAWIHVQDHGTAEIEEELLHACLHSVLYDGQLEEGRSRWLLDMVERSPQAERFFAAITAALPGATDDRDAGQLGNLAWRLAEDGDAAARQALYARLENPPPKGDDGASFVIELDGVDGLLRVAEMRGRRLLADPEAGEDRWLVKDAEETYGEEEVRAALNDAASRSPAVRAYCDAIEKPRSERREPLGWTALGTVLEKVEAAAETYPLRFMFFGQKASQDDLEAVFARLLAETRRDQQLRCLWVFRQRAVPRCADLLVSLAESTDAEMQEAACAALAGTCDPRVRALALRLLERPESLCSSSLQLFLANLEEGDPERIAAALWVPDDRRKVHSIGLDLLDLAGAHPDEDWTDCLLWLAEHGPCSMCRSSALSALVKNGTAPEALLEECLSDAVEEIRELAAQGLGLSDSNEPES